MSCVPSRVAKWSQDNVGVTVPATAVGADPPERMATEFLHQAELCEQMKTPHMGG